jgi:hypothetical protein
MIHYALSSDNPLLDIGSSYSGLREDVNAWLVENLHPRWKFFFASNIGQYCLHFDNDEDFTMFLLRWS